MELSLENLEKNLTSYPTIAQIEALYAELKSGSMDTEEGYRLLESLSREFRQLLDMETQYSVIHNRSDLRELRQYRSKRKIFAVRVVKLLAFRWWKDRDDFVGDRTPKPRELKDRISPIVEGLIPEDQLINTLWQVRNSYKNRKERFSPIKRLEELLKNEEGTTVEVKKSLMLQDAICRTICSFANTSGGTIIVGLAELEKIQDVEGKVINGSFVLCGLEGDIDSSRIKLTMLIGEKVSIDVSELFFEIENINSKKVMYITVPSARQIKGELVFYNRDAYIREDNHNKKLSGAEVYSLSKQMFDK